MARFRRVAVLVVGCAALLSACGGESTPKAADEASTAQNETSTAQNGTTSGTDFDAACQAAREIAELDNESQALINELFGGVISGQGDPAEAERMFNEGIREWKAYAEEKMPEILDAYERLEASVPSSLAADVRSVKDFSVSLFELIADLERVEDLQSLQQDLATKDAQEAVQATFRVDEFTREECNVTFAD